MSNDKIVTITLRFLHWFCPHHLVEEIEGDLVQKFNRDVTRFGKRRAKKKLLWNTIRFLRPGIVLRNRISITLIPFYMIRNYIKIAFRNFQRQKSYTLL